MNTIEQAAPPAPPKSRKKLIILGIIALIICIIIGVYLWINRTINPVILSDNEQRALDTKIEVVEERTYDKGGKILELSEREVNALFHHNTGLGDKVRIELANNAVHARIVHNLDPDTPVVGGRTLKVRARFMVTDEHNQPAIILDDFTLWGLSLPNAWLGELKGQNLISSLGVDLANSQVGKGIKRIEITNGKILIELAE